MAEQAVLNNIKTAKKKKKRKTSSGGGILNNRHQHSSASDEEDDLELRRVYTMPSPSNHGSSGGVGTDNNGNQSPSALDHPISPSTADSLRRSASADTASTTKPSRTEHVSATNAPSLTFKKPLPKKPSAQQQQPTKSSSTSNGTSASAAHKYTDKGTTASVSSKSKPASLVVSTKPQQRVDKFGFILNMDHNGELLHDDLETEDHHDSTPPVPSFAQVQRVQRRLRKWNQMTRKGTITRKHLLKRSAPHPTVLRRLRKGLPDSIRPQIWMILGNVQESIRKHPGRYDTLVRQTLVYDNDQNTNENGNDDQTHHYNQQHQLDHSRSFLNLQETIERDIHRTFPRHAMFHAPDDDSSDEEDPTDDEEERQAAADREAAAAAAALSRQQTHLHQQQQQLCVPGADEISAMIRDLEFTTTLTTSEITKPLPLPPTPETTTATAIQNQHGVSTSAAANSASMAMHSPQFVLNGRGGQASLRRVLKAYSLHDKDVGYCQGMNFIAGMFLTLMAEEEAFWLLVHVMNEAPCKLRGLFGEGMKETHQVLYIADKLIQQFLPKIHRHFHSEHIHITMFATQWLLTHYTSSFRFDLVTRVWDCFLCEGWKITYRVMLAILGHYQPTLLTLSFEDILAFFRELPSRIEGPAIVDEANKIPLKRSHIGKYAREWEQQLQQ